MIDNDLMTEVQREYLRGRDDERRAIKEALEWDCRVHFGWDADEVREQFDNLALLLYPPERGEDDDDD